MTEVPHHNPEHHALPVSLEILRRLDDAYSAIARGLITGRPDADDPANRFFAEFPDDPAEHSWWHQYGIYTHSRKFGEALQTTVPAFIEQWDLSELVNAALAVEIDGIPKEQLLQITALVHDLGKFTARRFEYDEETGEPFAIFTGHERESGEIIRSVLAPALRDWGLGKNAIEYVAACAELHYELGKVRRAAYEAGGFTVAFVESSVCTDAVVDILDRYPDYALEIGLMFIADSLSKTEVMLQAQTDEEIDAELPALETKLAAKGLRSGLIKQVSQLPINIKLGERSLRIWAERLSFISQPPQNADDLRR